MTLLSLFMTSTGIFCFVPISQRLIESGIVPPSNNWWSRGLPGALTPVLYDRKEDRLAFLLANDEAEDAWSDVKVSNLVIGTATRGALACCQTQSLQIPLSPAKAPDTFAADQQLTTPCTSEWCSAIVSPHEGSPTPSHIASFYGGESTSFTSVRVLSYLLANDMSRPRQTG